MEKYEKETVNSTLYTDIFEITGTMSAKYKSYET